MDRSALLDWYRRNRARSLALFDLVSEDAYYSQPISLRHPIVFYEGHLPAFSFNTLVRKALGGPSIDPALETLFARGIDPHEPNLAGTGGDSGAHVRNTVNGWPSRDTVHAFAKEADERVMAALAGAELDQPGHPLLDRAEAVYAILEHEAMHQETLLYMWHRLPAARKKAPPDYQPRTGAGHSPPGSEWMDVPEGIATLGVDRDAQAFGWDNERPACVSSVPSFQIERHDVTNARYLEFVEAGGYRDPRWWEAEDWHWVQGQGLSHPSFWSRIDGEWYWQGMFASVKLPLAWPVYVTLAEARAFAAWRGDRLPTEAEYQRAAHGSPDGERPYPWGAEPPASRHGVFDFSSWDPEPAGSHPEGASAWGVEDLVGNGWEWTVTPFTPFPGFEPMASYPEYSADFFDGEHFVMKGASPATARELLRPTFRNWFRARYPFPYATFRCARDL